MKRIAETIIKNKVIIITVTFILTVFFAYQLKNTKVNSDLLSYLPDNDSVAILFNEIGQKYGGTDMFIVGLKMDNVFTPQNISLLKEITDSVRFTEGIGFTTSLTHVIDIKGTDEGIEITKLIDEYAIPQDQTTLDSLKNYVLSKQRYKDVLVSSDFSTTLILAKIVDTKHKAKVVKLVQKKLKYFEKNSNIQFFFGGLPVSIYEVGKIILRDIMYLSPFALIIIIFVFYMGFRSVRNIFYPTLTVLIANIWAFGLMNLFHYEITIISNTLPVIIIAVGSAYSIHVINRIQEEIENGNKHALLHALAYIVIPVFLAASTTIFGFLSFIAGSYLTMIKDFGIFSAIGVLFSLILSVTFIPALMDFFPEKREDKLKLNNNPALIWLTSTITKWVLNHKKQVLLVWVLIMVFSFIGAFKVERRVDMLDYFKKDNDVRKSEKILQEKFTGSTPLYINVVGNVQSPEVLEKIDKVQAYVESLSYIKQSQSIADLIKEMNQVMGEGYKIPDSETKIQQLWILLEGQEIMDQLVGHDLNEALIQAYVATSSEEKMRMLNDSINIYLEKYINSENCKMSLTGFPSIYKQLGDSIINSQIKSLVIAIILVLLTVALIFKSLLKGIYAIIPILATLFVLFGSMGWLNIPLDIATVLTGSITVGIGIDYAIHIITHFGADYKQNKSLKLSITNTLRVSGRAVTINMLSVAFGFLVMIFADLVPLQRIGILVTITMLISGLAALTLLPATLLLSGEKLLAKFQLSKSKLNYAANH